MFFFSFFLAETLGKTLAEICKMSQKELLLWVAYFALKQEARDQEMLKSSATHAQQAMLRRKPFD